MRFFLILVLLFISACIQIPEAKIKNNQSKDRVEAGAKLVLGLGACGVCHGMKPEPESPLVGGKEYQDRYGSVYAANLSPSASGIGDWEFSDFKHAIRNDMTPEETYLSVEFHEGLKWLADEDLASIFAFLKSMQPVKNEVPRRELEFWDRNTTGIFETRYEVTGYVPKVEIKDNFEYGAYLVDHVADCGRCHNKKGGLVTDKEYLGGGEIIEVEGDQKYAPSLLPDPLSGIGDWSKQALINYLQTGKTIEGNRVDPKFCPVNFYRLANQKDLEAIASYLKSL